MQLVVNVKLKCTMNQHRKHQLTTAADVEMYLRLSLCILKANTDNNKSSMKEEKVMFKMFVLLNVPGIKGAEEEDNQSHNALSIPPLHHPRRACRHGLSCADIRHQAEQTRVTFTIYVWSQTNEDLKVNIRNIIYYNYYTN